MAFFGKKPKAAEDKPPTIPITTLVVADVALRTGQALIQRAIERGMLKGKKAGTGRVIRGRTLPETVVATVLAEVARRSVPGAILVGCGIIAKSLRDRRLAAMEKPDKDVVP